MSGMYLGNVRYRHGGEVNTFPASGFTRQVPQAIVRKDVRPMWQWDVVKTKAFTISLSGREKNEPAMLMPKLVSNKRANFVSMGLVNKTGRDGTKKALSPDIVRFVQFREWSKTLTVASRYNPEEYGDSFEAPNKAATGNARSVLAACYAIGTFPLRLDPSVEGGIGFTFMSRDRVGYVEADNTGSIVAGYFSNDEGPETCEVNLTWLDWRKP